jgi:dodecin
MTILKVIEVLAESEKSWEDAAVQAVNKVSQTIKNVKSIYIKEMEAKVENNKIIEYRINAKVSFEISPDKK